MSDRRHAMPGLLLVIALLIAGAALVGRQEAARAQNGDVSWTPVTVLYHSDTRGKIEPCG